MFTRLPLVRPLLTALTAIVLLTPLYATNPNQSVPRFSARTIDGEKFTNGTLKGSVVLLQFWATWCGVCRGDEPVLDSIDEEFGKRGLVILAVNVGESKRTVRQYLEARPRSGKVVLTEDTNLAALFPTRAVPYYVLIDRDGKILSARAGGGERRLRNIVSQAFPSNSDEINPDERKTMSADATPDITTDRDAERPRLVRRETPLQAPAPEPVPPPEPVTTVKGVLNRFDCLGEVARLHVSAGGQAIVLLIRHPDQIAIGGGGTRELRCGPQKTPVSVNFVDGKDDKYGTSGDVRAIDFLNAP